MPQYRLSVSAQEDITRILDRSSENFGEAAEARYAALIAAAIRHAASLTDDIGFAAHPEYGDGVLTWHLAHSATLSRGGPVRRPRHVLVCRWEGDVLAIGRVLHDSMDPSRHLARETDWY
jgi:toxin ParE1/3/4